MYPTDPTPSDFPKKKPATEYSTACSPRDKLRPASYWQSQQLKFQRDIEKGGEKLQNLLASSSRVSSTYFELRDAHFGLAMTLYSKGEPVQAMRPHLHAAVERWESAERAADAEFDVDTLNIARSWALNIDRYIESFWFVGLALVFEFDDIEWRRLIRVIENEGEDGLLDAVIASRDTTRTIGRSFCYPQPYGRLWEAAAAPRSHRALMLGKFTEDWYTAMFGAVRNARQEQATPTDYPRWMGQHNQPDGSYFGYWCIEALATARALRLEDKLARQRPYYPVDLIGAAQGGDRAHDNSGKSK